MVALDVVGYSALVEADESNALSAVRSIFATLLRPLAEKRAGRVVKTMGDGALLEFASAVQALCFAIEFQRSMAVPGQKTDPELVFRIGINLGDIVAEDNDIYGDGVNLAARLESKAPPGGILISRSVRDQVRDRFPVVLIDAGEIELKNLSRPARVFSINLAETADELPETPLGPKVRKPLRYVGYAAAGVLLLAAASASIWYIGQETNSEIPQVADLGARPSIAVLPFQNLNANADEDYFAEGVARDIVADLSQFDELMVIASSSSLAFQGNNHSPEAIAQELGARYILDGDLRRSSERVRINAQLIDAQSRQAVWADRFDAEAEDLFELEDQITAEIVRALTSKIVDLELERSRGRATDNLQAHDLYLQGRAAASKFTRSDLLEARDYLRAALEKDPQYASALAELGFTYFHAVTYGWSPSPNAALDLASELATQAIENDPDNVAAHRLLGRVLQFRGRFDAGLAQADNAVTLNPNDAAAREDRGIVRLWSGNTEGSRDDLTFALELNPLMGAEGLFHLSLAHHLLGNYKEAIRLLSISRERDPDFALTHAALAAALAEDGQTIAARNAVDELLRLDPFFPITEFGGLFRNPSDADAIVSSLHKAGAGAP